MSERTNERQANWRHSAGEEEKDECCEQTSLHHSKMLNRRREETKWPCNLLYKYSSEGAVTVAVNEGIHY